MPKGTLTTSILSFLFQIQLKKNRLAQETQVQALSQISGGQLSVFLPNEGLNQMPSHCKMLFSILPYVHS